MEVDRTFQISQLQNKHFHSEKAKIEIMYDLVPKCLPFSKLFYSAIEIEASRIYALCHIESHMIQLN